MWNRIKRGLYRCVTAGIAAGSLVCIFISPKLAVFAMLIGGGVGMAEGLLG